MRDMSMLEYLDLSIWGARGLPFAPHPCNASRVSGRQSDPAITLKAIDLDCYQLIIMVKGLTFVQPSTLSVARTGYRKQNWPHSLIADVPAVVLQAGRCPFVLILFVEVKNAITYYPRN
jgi:hypothetical protein